MKIERRDDPQTQEHVITITLTREEMLRAGEEMTPNEREEVYLMSQSPLLSTQLSPSSRLHPPLRRPMPRRP